MSIQIPFEKFEFRNPEVQPNPEVCSDLNTQIDNYYTQSNRNLKMIHELYMKEYLKELAINSCINSKRIDNIFVS